ncbi:MAG: hypothetical protein QNJ31_06770 [Candidatus Caenarcaniphilales bacterium]|nr:hypothetical protein [Candidatus Caenarcaniphilales bacterium]
MVDRMDLKDLIHKTIYSTADLNSQIPDVNQMAEFLYQEISPSSMDFDLFSIRFLEQMGNDEILKSAFFDGVIESVLDLIAKIQSLQKEVLISSWTQGNVFLQTKKAQVFQKELPKELLAKPSIYASLDKIGLLSHCYQDLKDQGCDLICLVDDRLVNVLAARKVLQPKPELLFIHKIRPDKPVTHRLQEEDENLYECKEWHEIENLVTKKEFNKLGLILDKDGVIYNSTEYRKKLEKILVDFADRVISKV